MKQSAKRRRTSIRCAHDCVNELLCSVPLVLGYCTTDVHERQPFILLLLCEHRDFEVAVDHLCPGDVPYERNDFRPVD